MLRIDVDEEVFKELREVIKTFIFGFGGNVLRSDGGY
jgi:hypothetical protein